MIGLLAIGSEQKNPLSANEEDAPETVPRHHASLKPPVMPRYHWVVQKYLHHNPGIQDDSIPA